jgi:hypothetical protein
MKEHKPSALGFLIGLVILALLNIIVGAVGGCQNGPISSTGKVDWDVKAQQGKNAAESQAPRPDPPVSPRP